MAWIRERHRKDGSVYYQVAWRLADGSTTSDSYTDRAEAERTKKLVEAVGGDKALEILGISRDAPARPGELTLTEWLHEYVDHYLADPDEGTVIRYKAYIRNDIDPVLGPKRLSELDRKDITLWLQWLSDHGAVRGGKRGPASPKTIMNKYGFLAQALAAAVPKHIPASPASKGMYQIPDEPREAEDEMVILTPEQFARLIEFIPGFWKPLVRFLVVSGVRWGEAVALKPSDVDRQQATVRIRRAWTYSSGGYRIVRVKGKGRRTINVDPAVLAELDYSHDWLFVNHHGGPVRAQGFYNRVWSKAVERSGLSPRPRIHDLRHTCASHMLLSGVPITVVSRHLGHQSVTTTDQIYSHLLRDSFEQAASAMNTFLNCQ